jgi:RNA polymerase sigma factor (sigma-70 family)
MNTDLKRVVEIFINDRDKFIGFIRKKMNGISEMDAEDIMSEVFVNIFNKGDISAQIENLSAYIYASLRNKMIDLINYSVKNRDYIQSDDADIFILLQNIPDRNSDVEANLLKKEDERLLYTALSTLDREQREIIIATEIEGRSFKEMSEELNIPIGTLISRKNRGIKKLKKIENGDYNG